MIYNVHFLCPQAIDTKSSVVLDKSQQLATLDSDAADLSAELTKVQNELRRKATALDLAEHEKAELSGRLAVAESSLADREKELDSLRHNHTERQVQLGQARADVTSREEEIAKLQQVRLLKLYCFIAAQIAQVAWPIVWHWLGNLGTLGRNKEIQPLNKFVKRCWS